MKKLILGILTAALIALGLVGAPADAAPAPRAVRTAPCAPDSPCTVPGLGSVTIVCSSSGCTVTIKFKFAPTARVAAGHQQVIRGKLYMTAHRVGSHTYLRQQGKKVIRHNTIKLHTKRLPSGTYKMHIKFVPNNHKVYRTAKGTATVKL